MSGEKSIEIINPVAAVSAATETLEGVRSVEKVEGLRVGLLENNTRHADEFLQHVGEAVSEKFEASVSIQRKKGQWVPHDEAEAIYDEIAASADAAVTGFGV